MIDYDDPHELTSFLQSFMDLMSVDVRGVHQPDYEQRIEEPSAVATQSTEETITRRCGSWNGTRSAG